MKTEGLPYFTVGKIIKGFGRGSKELGIPTANLEGSVVDNVPSNLSNGVYYGFAKVDFGPVYKMVMSLGWNPHYHNTKKSLEVHIMHTFGCDLYGKVLKIVALGYIRNEKCFASVEELIEAINNDIAEADKRLDAPEAQMFKGDPFFL